ncbi:8033_t:CDS:2 [Paraglomus brasilianum]|uniref:8033_t:CDS:1 n=1 Tax=Paraglomus brasilianum TaxID=144538 RepID=A0A9N9H1W2_9GLOM|nr:8033_t:CDS:2 [Paraglomus brasilianum]
MDASTSKRNGPTPSKAYKRNQRKKLVRYAKKAELGKRINAVINEESSSTHNTSNDNEDDRDDDRTEIPYNPKKLYKSAFPRHMTAPLEMDFIPIVILSIKPIYLFEKFLEKRRQRQVVRRSLDQGLLPSNAIKTGTYILDFAVLSDHHLEILSNIIQENLYEDDVARKKSLPPQSIQAIPTFSDIPQEFMCLLESEIFILDGLADQMERNYSKESPEHKQLWKEFALWACFFAGPNFNQRFRHYCRRLCDKLSIAEETTEIVVSGVSLNGFQHVFNSQCFTNTLEETVVDFFNIDKVSARKSEAVVDKYCKHMFDDPTHQSKNFKTDLIEHFGCFADSNNLPYTTSNTASSHHKAHMECVKSLIQGLQPLSNSVNNYFEATYPNLYTKMKKLDLGPNVPKSFGAFPTVAINFNIICQFHRDLKDHRNTLCVVCPLGNFEGEELTFPELKLIVHVKQGQAVAFRSNLLVHGNLPVVAGVRHSVVFYIYSTVIKQKRKFGSLFADYELDWGDNNDDKPSQEYLPPTLGSGNNDVKLKNHRRTNIDLERAKKGLPARYKK